MKRYTRNPLTYNDSHHRRRTAPLLVLPFVLLLGSLFAGPAQATEGGQSGNGYVLAVGADTGGGYALVDNDRHGDRGRDRDRGRHGRDWDRHDRRDWDRHDRDRYDDRYRHDRHRHHYRYDDHRGGYRGHYRPRHFTVPRVIVQANYRDYYYGRVYHSAHHHYHDVYRFPVYAAYGVDYYPYAYCGGEYYGRGVFEYQGPRIGFHIRF